MAHVIMWNGRARTSWFSAFQSALLLLLLVVAAVGLLGGERAEAHVIGIDFGSEFVKVAGPHADQSVDIVLNELSKRKTDNFMGFRNGEHYIGDQAKSLAARFPLLTVTAINQLVGMQKGLPEAEAFANMQYEFELDYTKRGTVSVPVKDAHGPFTVEELYSMFLSYASQISVHDGVVLPNSAVVTIPFHASTAERRAILDAARLANVDILGFLHSTTAAALYYGMRHRGFGDRNVTMVVFDVGTMHTEAGIYSFTPAPAPAKQKRQPLGESFGTLSTVAIIEDKTLGGRALDLCVAKVIEDEAVAKMGIKPVLGGRMPAQLKSQFSLLRAANNAREVLSANSNTPLSVEGIAPERDFHSVITREIYETACAPLFNRVKELVTEVFSTTGLKPSEVDAFELMGGAARTPRIIADISAILGREVDRTLNMDEAAAIGAAYYGVKLSTFYRVKSFKVNEHVPSPLSFTVSPPPSNNEKKQQQPSALRELFTTDDLIGNAISVSFNRTDDFTLNIYDDAQGKNKVGELRVSGVQVALEKLHFLPPAIEHPNNTHVVRLQLRVNESGLLEVEDAEVHVRYAANTSRLVLGDSTTTPEDSAAEEVVLATKMVTEYAVRMRHSSRKVQAHLTWVNPREMTSSEWLASETKLFEIKEHERVKRESAEAKNNLEGYMFWIKGDGVLYNDDLVAKLDPAMVAKLRSATDKTELWLEEGRGSSDACTRQEFEKEHTVLKALVKEATGEKEDEQAEAEEPDDEPVAPAGQGGDDSASAQDEHEAEDEEERSTATPAEEAADDDGDDAEDL